MKRVDLKTALGKFHKKRNRFEATFTMVSKPDISGKRRVLLNRLKINGQEIIDHLWVKYTQEFKNFIGKQAGQEITFVGTVGQSGPKHLGARKYTINDIKSVQTVKDYIETKRSGSAVKQKDSRDYSDSKQFLKILPYSRRKFLRTKGLVSKIEGQNVLLKDVMSEDEIFVKNLWVKADERKINVLKVGQTVEADMLIEENLHRKDGESFVKSNRMKNLKILNEES